MKHYPRLCKSLKYKDNKHIYKNVDLFNAKYLKKYPHKFDAVTNLPYENAKTTVRKNKITNKVSIFTNDENNPWHPLGTFDFSINYLTNFKTNKPDEHIRKLKSGKTVLVNKGISDNNKGVKKGKAGRAFDNWEKGTKGIKNIGLGTDALKRVIKDTARILNKGEKSIKKAQSTSEQLKKRGADAKNLKQILSLLNEFQ